MLLELTDDQAFFRDTTARFLEELAPVGELRRRRDDPVGFDRDYWRRGAELGWTSLLVPDAHGGGTISGRGLVDLTLVAHEFGRHAAPGPLVPANVAAAALSATGTHLDVLVTGRTDDGVTQVLVPRDVAGLGVSPLRTIDLTRRFASVRFDGVRVPA